MPSTRRYTIATDTLGHSTPAPNQTSEPSLALSDSPSLQLTTEEIQQALMTSQQGYGSLGLSGIPGDGGTEYYDPPVRLQYTFAGLTAPRKKKEIPQPVGTPHKNTFKNFIQRTMSTES